MHIVPYIWVYKHREIPTVSEIETIFDMITKVDLLDCMTKFVPAKLRNHLIRSLERTADEQTFDKVTLTSERVDMFTSLRRLSTLGFTPSQVIDVGAHEGIFSKKVSKIFPTANFVLIEGNPEKIGTLERFIAQDQSRFRLHGVLLGATNDVVKFHIMEGETGSSVFLEQSNLGHKIVEVAQVRLSDIILTSESPSLIKLDVQGYESLVLKGIDPCHYPHFFLCELSLLPLNKGVPDFDALINQFADMGYVLYDICGITRRPLDSAIWQVDGLFVRKDSEYRRQLITGHGGV
jgi:FkbM family methyltransferase